MNPNIERILNLMSPSNRKVNLFFVACNRHVWKYLTHAERNDLLVAEKEVELEGSSTEGGWGRRIYKQTQIIYIWGSYGTAWLVADRTDNPVLHDVEREWQYKLLKHMFKDIADGY